MALSRGRTSRLLRRIVDLEGGNAFGKMLGALPDSGASVPSWSAFIPAISDTGSAVTSAAILCTPTAAAVPILYACQVSDGVHLNIVGSGRAGPAEIDTGLARAV